MSKEASSFASSLPTAGPNRDWYSSIDTDKIGSNERYLIPVGGDAVEFERSKPLFSSDILKSVVFGGLDGLITTLAIISGAAGGQFSRHVVLVMGFSSIAANALSMGVGEYLSSKAHREFIQVEKRRETWEFKHFKDVEIREMVMRFIARGMGKVDAELCVAKMAQYETFFVNLMVTEELGLRLPDDDDGKLLTDAFLMTVSFGLFGSLPLVVYFFGSFQYSFITELNMFYASGLVATVLMFILGSMKCFFSTVFWIYSGIETVVVALVASGLAYVLGSIVIKMLTL